MKIALASCPLLAAPIFLFLALAEFWPGAKPLQATYLLIAGLVFAIVGWRAARMRVILDEQSITVHRIWPSRRVALEDAISFRFRSGYGALWVLSLESLNQRPIKTYMIAKGLSGELTPYCQSLVDEMNEFITAPKKK